MKAIRIHGFGGTETLRLSDAPIPAISAPDQVLVRVASSSVNPVDRATLAGYMGEVELPYTLGWDVAGFVEQVGAAVTHVAPGDAVYGMIPMRGGAYAEYALMLSSELARVPRNLPPEQAGAVPGAGLTAWQELQLGGVVAGQRVLIMGGSGGVGHFAVQMAAALGAYVIATTSTRNVEFVRALGAAEVIDYTTTSVADAAGPVDVAIDTIGMATATEALGLVKAGGALIGVMGVPEAQAAAAGVRAVDMTVMPTPEDLTAIAALFESGAVRTHIDLTVTLATLAQGFNHNATGRTRGKVLVQVAG